MDGNVPPLDRIYKLAEKYDAMVMVDESHSAGVVGDTGRGVTELFNLKGKIEIITGTLGKAFGGAIGGFTTGKKRDYRYASAEVKTLSLLKFNPSACCSSRNPG
jgi:glycine C-acetyltransferase